MEKFVLQKATTITSSISRTLRFQGDVYDKIENLREKTGLSFNKIVMQCLDYALKNLDDSNL